MTSRATVIIPVEEQVRELDSKLFLAAHLAAKGARVIVGRRDRIEACLDQFPRGVYLGMDLRAPRTYETARLLGHRVVAWDEEAVVHYPPAIYASRRVDPRAMGCVSALLAWGEDNVSLWSPNTMIAGAADVFKTGNPRGDMLRAECRALHAPRAAELAATYGDYVLVNTNFGSINSINPQLNLYTRAADGREIRGKGAVGMPEAYARGLHEHRTKLFHAFKDVVLSLAATFPELTIIVRPHPMEDWNAYSDSVGEAAPNIKVIHEGSVIPWIMSARAIVHNGCNTGIEAYCLGVPALAFQPVVHDDYDSDLPNELSHRVFDLEALISALHAVMAGELGPAETPDRNAVLDHYIDARDGRFAADRIADVLLDVAANERFPEPPLVDRALGGAIARQHRRERAASKKSYARTISHRFKGVSVEYVSERLSAMREIAGLPSAVEIREREPNVMEIVGSDAPARSAASAFRKRQHEFPISGLLSAPMRRWRLAQCNEIAPVENHIVKRVPEPRLFRAPAPDLSAGGKWKASKPRASWVSHVAEIPNGYASVLGGVFGPSGRVIHGASHKYDVAERYHWFLRPPNGVLSRLNQTARVLDEPAIVMTASTQTYFYHWLIDVLPRLNMVRERLPEALLYVAQSTAFQRDTLAAFVIDPARIVEASGNRLITSPKLIVPCFQVMPGQEVPPWVVEFLRKHIGPLANGVSPKKGRRLFVSRRGTKHRRVRNEDEVARRLEASGFETVLLEGWSLAEQIAAFRDADVIVGPHGGGLTNLIFCSPGAFAVELFPNTPIDLYYRVANAAGVDYGFVCDRHAPEPTGREAEVDQKRLKLTRDDYTIDPDDVIDVLKRRGVSV